MIKRKALFLDRDGVININYGYVYKVDNFVFVKGIFELVKQANLKGYLVIIATNQAGIARGFYTEDDFFKITKWMKNEFKKNGCHIDEVYYCPYHPEFGIGEYKKTSSCRKPNPGMLLRAKTDFNIDMQNSIMVGDSISDIEAAENAKIGRKIFFGDPIIDNTISVKCLLEINL